MPYILDDFVRAVADSKLPSHFLNMTIQGDRDLATGGDRTTMTFVDPRVSGAISLDLVLARAVASAWRRPEGAPIPPFRLLVGTTLGETRVAEVGIEDWRKLSQIGLASDGNPTTLGYGSNVRRFVAVDGAEVVYDLFRLAGSRWAEGFSHVEGQALIQDQLVTREQCLPGNLTVRLGEPSTDPLLAHFMALAGSGADAGADQAVCLMLFSPANTTPRIGDAGGPQNAWRGGREATNHMSGTHVTRLLAQSLASTPAQDPWTDDGYREELFQALTEARNGERPEKREFLNTLAGASPLRKLLPVYLTRFFPEVETVFWCCGDPLWDKSSPADRFMLLADTVKAEMAGNAAS